MNRIDIHCHALYGMDDGAQTFEDSCRMLETAASDGTCAMILTSHYEPCTYECEPARYEEHFQQLSAYAAKMNPKLQLYRGCEIFLGVKNVVDDIFDRRLHTLAGSNYVLVEFDPLAPIKHIESELIKLNNSGLWPILAHVERYEELVGREEELRRLALFQVNARAVIGKNGWSVKRRIRRLIRNGLVSFIASDGHSTGERNVVLSVCADKVAKRFGQEMAESLFWDNPKAILENRRLS